MLVLSQGKEMISPGNQGDGSEIVTKCRYCTHRLQFRTKWWNLDEVNSPVINTLLKKTRVPDQDVNVWLQWSGLEKTKTVVSGLDTKIKTRYLGLQIKAYQNFTFNTFRSNNDS